MKDMSALKIKEASPLGAIYKRTIGLNTGSSRIETRMIMSPSGISDKLNPADYRRRGI